jgi:DNA-directed RNA polymerase specialized sigma24 family protein
MLHIPIGTVKSRSNRARLELARTVLAIEARGQGEGAAGVQKGTAT